MKKTLIALAVLGAAAGVAHAQSNVTIYGIVDTGFIKESGSDIKMGENVNNRIGFRGVEDLGSGQKATFELEKRFELADGTLKESNGYKADGKTTDWDGAANVGLKGDNWGAVRLGRVNELTTESIRKFDPFYQYGVASMFLSKQRSARISNTVRYDSLNWSGFHFGASYSLGGNTNKDSIKGAMIAVDQAGADNDGYAISLGYDNGPLSLAGNWSRLADSNKSYTWNLGAAYKFGPARVSLAYENTKNKGWKLGDESAANAAAGMALGEQSKQQNWLLGLEWTLGPGRLNASVNYNQIKDVASWNDNKDNLKYAIGYTYNLSKRTSIYGNVAYTDYDDEQAAGYYGYQGRDSVTGVQVGITHKF